LSVGNVRQLISWTIQGGNAIAPPIRGKQIIDIVREINGEIITISDYEIEQSFIEICRNGLYAELTAAASIAGFRKYKSSNEEIVIAPLTSHGLKSTEKINLKIKTTLATN